MTKLYYTAPTDEIFLEVRSACITVWNLYDDTYGYATEKINRIKDLENISDNFMYMIAMFDGHNQQRLALILSDETRQAISDRLIDGGTPPEYNYFI